MLSGAITSRTNWNDHIPELASRPDAPKAASPALLFTGISNTREVQYAREQLVRLAPQAYEVLNRDDASGFPGQDGLARLYSRGRINLVYKVFTVVLSYPWSVINQQSGLLARWRAMWRNQAGVDSRDPARPDYFRWGRVQRALDTINRLAFRLALADLQRIARVNGKPRDYHAADPLGYLANLTRWRCFLLYHWDFVEVETVHDLAAPPGASDPFGHARREKLKPQGTGQNDAPLTVEDVTRQLRNECLVFDPNPSPNQWLEAARYCQEHLNLLIASWKRFIEVIEHCEQPDIGFRRLISDRPCHDSDKRWQALKREGYVLADLKQRGKRSDPTALERCHLDTKFVLVTLNAADLAAHGLERQPVSEWQHASAAPTVQTATSAAPASPPLPRAAAPGLTLAQLGLAAS
jgi:hypothetical protein